MRYTLYLCGPDNHSTYSECWGANASSLGRELAESGSLARLVSAAGAIRHENWLIRDHHRGNTISPGEFWKRPVVISALVGIHR
jgi:hypothetical protein